MRFPRVLAPTSLARTAAAALAAASWLWPVGDDDESSPAPHAVIRPFSLPAGPFGAGHRGVDLAASEASAVLAPADGEVHFVGFVVDRPVLSVRLSTGVLVSFEPVVSPLTAGDRVAAGERIGVIASGHCARPCVHVGARVGGQYVSPLLWLGGHGRSVLLPLEAAPLPAERGAERSP